MIFKITDLSLKMQHYIINDFGDNFLNAIDLFTEFSTSYAATITNTCLQFSPVPHAPAALLC